MNYKINEENKQEKETMYLIIDEKSLDELDVICEVLWQVANYEIYYLEDRIHFDYEQYIDFIKQVDKCIVVVDENFLNSLSLACHYDFMTAIIQDIDVIAIYKKDQCKKEFQYLLSDTYLSLARYNIQTDFELCDKYYRKAKQVLLSESLNHYDLKRDERLAHIFYERAKLIQSKNETSGALIGFLKAAIIYDKIYKNENELTYCYKQFKCEYEVYQIVKARNEIERTKHYQQKLKNHALKLMDQYEDVKQLMEKEML